MSITVIPSDESCGPKLGSVREKLLRITRNLDDIACAGGGLGSGDLDRLVRDLTDVARRAHDNDSSGNGHATVVEAVATSFRDLDKAERLIRETKAMVASRVDTDDADPAGEVSRGISSVMSLLLRAQSTIGATRLVRA